MVGFNDYYLFIVTNGSKILNSTWLYLVDNLSCLTVGFELLALKISKFLAYHSLLADMAELFGVLLVVTVLVLISFTLLIVITETGLISKVSNRLNLKSRTNFIKTTFFKKYTNFKSNFKNFF